MLTREFNNRFRELMADISHMGIIENVEEWLELLSILTFFIVFTKSKGLKGEHSLANNVVENKDSSFFDSTLFGDEKQFLQHISNACHDLIKSEANDKVQKEYSDLFMFRQYDILPYQIKWKKNELSVKLFRYLNNNMSYGHNIISEYQSMFNLLIDSIQYYLDLCEYSTPKIIVDTILNMIKMSNSKKRILCVNSNNHLLHQSFVENQLNLEVVEAADSYSVYLLNLMSKYSIVSFNSALEIIKPYEIDSNQFSQHFDIVYLNALSFYNDKQSINKTSHLKSLLKVSDSISDNGVFLHLSYKINLLRLLKCISSKEINKMNLKCIYILPHKLRPNSPRLFLAVLSTRIESDACVIDLSNSYNVLTRRNNELSNDAIDFIIGSINGDSEVLKDFNHFSIKEIIRLMKEF